MGDYLEDEWIVCVDDVYYPTIITCNSYEEAREKYAELEVKVRRDIERSIEMDNTRYKGRGDVFIARISDLFDAESKIAELRKEELE